MPRHVLTDREWNAIRTFLPPERPNKPGRPWIPHRQVVNGILWVLATGSGWRDVPADFGKWQTVYNRFRRWTKENLWDRIQRRLLEQLDEKGKIDRTLWCVDGSVVRAHRVAAGGSRKERKNAEENALGRSRGGYSTKIHVVTDAHGLLLSVTATAGQKGEAPEFDNVMQGIPLSLHRKRKRPQAIAGDKAYSTKAIRSWLNRRGILDAIPRRSNECPQRSFRKRLYRKRNVVERVIGRLKESRRIATRYDKTVEHFLAMITIATLRLTLKHN